MKHGLYILLSLLLFGCYANQKPLANQLLITSLEYEVITKGKYYKCMVLENEFYEKTTREVDFVKRKLHVLEAAELQLALEELKVEEMAWLDVPSNDRFSDNGMHAVLIINQNGNRYQSQAFDHHQPNKKIKPIINVLFKFTTHKL
jgi:hypothetical protein